MNRIADVQLDARQGCFAVVLVVVAVRAGEGILWNSYVRLVPIGSISYGSIAFYGAKEAVMVGLLAIVSGFVLMALFIAYEMLRGRVSAGRRLTVQTMVRFGFSRAGQGARGRHRDAAARQAPGATSSLAPSPGAVIFEVGLVRASHLAVAAVVLLIVKLLVAS